MYSKTKGSLPVTLHNSSDVSFEQPLRKNSMVSLHHPNIDIDKVMVDIKLTPLKYNQVSQKVKTIYECLDFLRKASVDITEEIRTAQLIVENIEHKLFIGSSNHSDERLQNIQEEVSGRKRSANRQRGTSLKNSATKPIQSTKNTPLKRSKHTENTDENVLSQRKFTGRSNSAMRSNIDCDISPIKQLDDMTSGIVYTNFSIKEMEQLSLRKAIQDDPSIDLSPIESCFKRKENSSQLKCQVSKKDPKIFTVSKFDPEDQQIQKLNRNIEAIDRVLMQKKTNLRNSVYKKGNRSVKKDSKECVREQKQLRAYKKRAGGNPSAQKKLQTFSLSTRNSKLNQQNLN